MSTPRSRSQENFTSLLRHSAILLLLYVCCCLRAADGAALISFASGDSKCHHSFPFRKQIDPDCQSTQQSRRNVHMLSLKHKNKYEEPSRPDYYYENNNKENDNSCNQNDSNLPVAGGQRWRNRHNKSKKKSTTSSGKLESYSQAKRQKRASAAFDLPKQPLVTTLGGGTAMIFAMAQRMLWEQDKTTKSSSSSSNNDNNNNNNNNMGSSSNTDTDGTAVVGSFFTPNNFRNNVDFFPRWRPRVGISNFDPEIRAPTTATNNQVAMTIWRNVRKRNKPSLWRYALRTYERMGSNTGDTSVGSGDQSRKNSVAAVEKVSNIHHEGALLASAKLGLWEKALEIYEQVEKESQQNVLNKQGGKVSKKSRLSVYITDGMVMSLVYACVHASRNMSSTHALLEERRRPLDAARQVLKDVASRHGIKMESRHYNPLAAAYQRLGLRMEAEELIHQLKDRKTGPEPEDGPQQFNIHDLSTKNKASYSLLVTGAVQEEDWDRAVLALKNMTVAGLFPNQRHLNVWTEVGERKMKHRTTRSWKKKRDELWIDRGLR